MKRKHCIYLLIATGALSFFMSNCKKDNTPPSSVIDYDGNVYHTISIGSQVWMVENLKVTHYQNGDIIPNVTDNTQWENLKTGACCSYKNDNNNVITYGLLYNWFAATDSRNICPKGWRVPSKSDCETLENYLGGTLVAGNKMKETGTLHWINPNNGASNESGFTGLPGGFRSPNCYDLGIQGYWWSSTDIFDTNASGRGLRNGETDFKNLNYPKDDGFSIRCLWNNYL